MINVKLKYAHVHQDSKEPLVLKVFKEHLVIFSLTFFAYALNVHLQLNIITLEIVKQDVCRLTLIVYRVWGGLYFI